MIVISDVSSRVGSRLALDLLKSGEQVRGINNHRERLASLKSEGMELAIGEQSDPVFLLSAFRDADTAFLIAPSRPDINNFSKTYKDTADAYVKAIGDSKVRNVLFLSSMGVNQSTDAGMISGLRIIEKKLNSLSLENIVFLRPGYFMEHLLPKITYIKTRDMIADSINGDTPLYMVCEGDVSALALSMLRDSSFYGRSELELYGERISYRQATHAIGLKINIPELPYEQVLSIDMRNDLLNMGYSINMADEYIETTNALSSGVVSPVLIDPETPNAPTRFDQFLDEVFLPAYNSAV